MQLYFLTHCNYLKNSSLLIAELQGSIACQVSQVLSSDPEVSSVGANNTKLMGSIPIWADRLRVGHEVPPVSLPMQIIL